MRKRNKIRIFDFNLHQDQDRFFSKQNNFIIIKYVLFYSKTITKIHSLK